MKFTSLMFFIVLFLGCKDNYKMIPSQINSNNDLKEINSKSLDSNTSTALHTVVVKEVIPTATLTYLKVTEKGKSFWIAANKVDTKLGETYYYIGGQLKNNFESKELNKVFEELYFIGNLVAANHGTKSPKGMHVGDEKLNKGSTSLKIVAQEGSIKISEIVNNPKKYEGQTVQIDGICTKINVGIMDRNWIHLRDGSQDDFDLVVTSNEMVSIGSFVTIKAIVVLNKDFGAGYTYDLILEQGKQVK